MTRRLPALVTATFLVAVTSTPSDASQRRIISFKADPHARTMPVYAPQFAPCCTPGPGVYTPRAATKKAVKKRTRKPQTMRRSAPPFIASTEQWGARGAAQILPHPQGCPPRAFCGCGAALDVFGRHVRDLWLARNWFRFPRAEPAPGMVAVRRHHVFVIREVRGPGVVLAYDANSGGRKTRLHLRSLSGYVVVDPRGGSRYAAAG